MFWGGSRPESGEPLTLTPGIAVGTLRIVSSHGKDSDKKHRHDVGDVSHGAVTQERVTLAVQYTLGMCVIGTAILVVYALSAGAL